MPENSELVEHEPKEIYVRPTNPNSKLGFKFGRGILISIEVDVLEDYQQAIDDADSRLLMLFKKSTEDLLRAWLKNYDPGGEKGACPRFCVNGLMAGSCLDLQRKRNDRKQRTDRPPAG